MPKTLFQRIIDREIPSKVEYEDEHCIAIHDIDPQAPVHVLIIPKKPIARLSEAQEGDKSLLGHLMLAAATVARKLDLPNGYRLVINNGPDACESVLHLHMHLLAKRQLKWPPG